MEYDINTLVTPGWNPSGDPELDRLNEMYYNPPQVRIDNGRVLLSGSAAFLNSQVGQDLKNSLNDTYVGHSIDMPEVVKAVEAQNVWLEDVARNSISNQQALIDLRKANDSATMDDLYEIGRAQVAGDKTNPSAALDQIISGYEWDDEGNRHTQYTTTGNILSKWNNMNYKKRNEEIQTLMSRAKYGDIAAIAEFEFLRGGSENGFRNINTTALESVGNLAETAMLNVLGSFSAGILRVASAAEWVLNRPLALTMGEDKLAHTSIMNYANSIDEALAFDAASRGIIMPVSTKLGQTAGQTLGNVMSSIVEFTAVAGVARGAAGVLTGALSRAGSALGLTTNVGFVVGQSGYLNAAWNRAGGVARVSGTLSGQLASGMVTLPMPLAMVNKFPRFSTALAKTMFKTAYGATAGAKAIRALGNFGAYLGVDFLFNAERYLQSSIQNDIQSSPATLSDGTVIAGVPDDVLEQEDFVTAVSKGMLRDAAFYFGIKGAAAGLGKIKQYAFQNKNLGLTTQDFDNIWDDVWEEYRRGYANGGQTHASPHTSPPVRTVTINGNPIDNAGQIVIDTNIKQTFSPPQWTNTSTTAGAMTVTTADGAHIIRTTVNANNSPVIELVNPNTGAVTETKTFTDIAKAEAALAELATPELSPTQIGSAVASVLPNVIAPISPTSISSDANKVINGGNRKYSIEKKGVDYNVVYMSPQEYFNVLIHNNDGYSSIDDIIARSDAQATTMGNKYVADLQNGEAVDVPQLLYNRDGSFAGQEGIHRAFAVETLGYPKMPVMMRTPASSLDRYVAMQDNLPRQYFDSFNTASRFAMMNPGTSIAKVTNNATPIAEIPISAQDWNSALPLNNLDDAVTYLKSQTTPVAYTKALAKAMQTMGVVRDSIADELAASGFSWKYAQTELSKASFAIDEGKIPELDPVFAELNTRLIQPFLQKAAEARGYDWTKSRYAGYHFPQSVGIEIPVNIDDMILDNARIGDDGFFKKRSGSLTTTETGERTVETLGNPIDAINSYWTSALTNGHKLDVLTNNQIAMAKNNPDFQPRKDTQIQNGVMEMYQLGAQIDTYKQKYEVFADSDILAENSMDMTASDRAKKQKEIWEKQKNYAKNLDFVRKVSRISQEELGYTPTNIVTKNINPGLFGINRANWASGLSAMEDIHIEWGKWGKVDGANTFQTGVVQGNNLIRYATGDDAYVAAADLVMNFGQGGYNTLAKGIGDFINTNMPWVSRYSYQLDKGMAKLNSNMTIDEQVNVVEDILNSVSMQGFVGVIRKLDVTGMNAQTEAVLNRTAAQILVGSPIKRNKLLNMLQTFKYLGSLGGLPLRVMILNPLEIARLFPKYGLRDTLAGLKNAIKNWPEYWRKTAGRSAYTSDLTTVPKNPFKRLTKLPEDATKGQVVEKIMEGMSNFFGKPFDVTEHAKNVLVFGTDMHMASLRHPNDLAKQVDYALQLYERDAITGGDLTSLGVNSQSQVMSMLTMFKGFSARQLDGFIKDAADAGGASGNATGGEQTGPNGERVKPNRGAQASFITKRVGLYVALWIMFVSKLGMSLKDWLGLDPMGATDEPFNRGLHDDPDTEENEGMQWYDEVINRLPLGPVAGGAQDLWFALRRAGFSMSELVGDDRLHKQFLGWVPAGNTISRFSDMLALEDRGFSVGSTGAVQFSAPKTSLDRMSGWMFGKWNTDGGRDYGRYNFGAVDPMNALLSGDFLEFAMSIPISLLGDQIPGLQDFNTSRSGMEHVFTGEFEDRARLAAAVVAFRKERDDILQDRTRSLNNTFPRDGETQQEARERALAGSQSKIDAYTEKVQTVVEAYMNRNPDGLTRQQVNSLIYLFDFDEGTDSSVSQFSDDWDSSYARDRYVEAGLPDPNDLGIAPVLRTNPDGTVQSPNPLNPRDSVIATNAISGVYGAPAKAATEIRNVLKGNEMDKIRREYSSSISAIYDAAKSNANGKPTSAQYAEIERQQQEYLATLEIKLGDLIDRYGMAILSSNEAVEELRPYLSGMVPYSTVIRGTSGNDVVWGTLKKWTEERWGNGQPSIPSDQIVLDSIEEIRRLIDDGKTASAKSLARDLRDRIARGKALARPTEMQFLQSVLAR